MNQIVFTAWVLLFPAACTTLGAAGVFLLRRRSRPCTQRILCGMAAGIMLAASVWSLLLPAIQRGQTLPLPAWIPSAVGLVLGAVGLLQVEQFAGQLLAGGAGHGGRMVLAVTLHNLPEGMVAGLAAALALTGEPDAISGALALSLGIGLQNIPEGAAVSLPLADCQIEIQRGLTTSSTAIFIPFTTQELYQSGKESLYYGLNALSNNLIMVDRKKLKNPNGLILGTHGSGKSFSAKREITNAFLVTDDDIIVNAPEGEVRHEVA